jgi:hypothetical protein
LLVQLVCGGVEELCHDAAACIVYQDVYPSGLRFDFRKEGVDGTLVSQIALLRNELRVRVRQWSQVNAVDGVPRVEELLDNGPADAAGCTRYDCYFGHTTSSRV